MSNGSNERWGISFHSVYISLDKHPQLLVEGVLVVKLSLLGL